MEEHVNIAERVFTFVGTLYPHSLEGVLSHHDFVVAACTILVAFVLLICASFATSRMQLVPSGMQNIFETLISGVIGFAKDIVGEEVARKYFPLAATIGLIVLAANLIGIIPGFEAPSSSLSFTLVLALVVFVYYHFEGIRAQGVVRYFKHFAGPVWWLVPLMLPVEIISHFSRIISLSFRLFGNIKGDDMFLLIMLVLVPWVVPVLPFAILTFMAFLQAFVFMILTYVYLHGAVVVDSDH
ncbi:MAG TPA: F0F1 ATP synthase subunit A [Candidatus Helicobacter avicola]|nr:F0F1 ATP synthase subunit A [Candidatus Helicobacter avicola]